MVFDDAVLSRLYAQAYLWQLSTLSRWGITINSPSKTRTLHFLLDNKALSCYGNGVHLSHFKSGGKYKEIIACEKVKVTNASPSKLHINCQNKNKIKTPLEA